MQLGDRISPVWSRGKAFVGDLEDEVSQKLKLFAHNILGVSTYRRMSGHRGHQWIDAYA